MTIARDARFAARQLMKHPAFTAVAVLTLALGIGATTALFSVVNGVLLKPSPLQDQDRLMMVWETDRNSGTTREPASLPDYQDFRDRSDTFDALAGFRVESVNLVRGDDTPVRLYSISSTQELLPMVGIEPLLGRTFTAEESRPGSDKVVLIGEALWERLYLRAPEVLGSALRLDDRDHTVIGVIPEYASFGVPQVLGAAAYGPGVGEGGRLDVGIWTPLQEEWPRSAHTMFVLGRLKPGTDRTAAQQELTTIAADLETSYAVNEGRGVFLEPLSDVVFAGVRPALLMLLGAVGIVLLVACANIANLLLARGTDRTREIAVRASLGASSRRLAQQFLVEGVLLALLGAGVGVGLAIVGTDLLLSFAPAGIPRLDAVGVDGTVLAVTLAATVLVGLVFGLVPTLQVRRANFQTALKSDAGVGTDASRGLLRSGLVVAELALAVVLVVGASLLLKSFWQIQRVDPGFRAEQVLKAEFQLPTSRYPVDFSVWPDFKETHRFNAELLDRVHALPGVESAAVAGNHPVDRGFTNSFTIVGGDAAAGDFPEISSRRVTPGYFQTVALAITKGRAFGSTDGTSAPAVAMINEVAAERLFPNRDPIGQRIAFWGTERRIVGVVANEKFQGLRADAPMAVYTPLAQTPSMTGGAVLLVRASGDPRSMTASIRAAIGEVDPQLAVFGVEPLRETVGRSIEQERFAMLLLGLFAAVAIALAAIGIHGVLTYVVARRTSEMGLRMALGASRRNVVGLVAAQGARLAVAGLGLGLAAALATTRLLQSLLYGITATDPATFVAVGAGVFAVAMLACFLPARRATRVDPMAALREK
jgi:putative ABC transport system permease protein